jgi:Domain of unknown function (DUF3473)
MIYLNPWELDHDQPRIQVGWRSSVPHYTNLATMAIKIKRLSQEFRFTSLTQACQQLAVFHSETSTTEGSATLNAPSGLGASSHPAIESRDELTSSGLAKS